MDADSTPGKITLGNGHIKINTIPSKGFIKFRKQIFGLIQIGANWEFHKDPVQDPSEKTRKQCAKVVLKPITSNSKTNWKFIYEPDQHEVSLLLKQPFPITKSLNVQVGFGANVKDRTILWKGKFTSPKDLHSGADNVSLFRDKRSFVLFPGVDLRLWWSANYALPEISGFLSGFSKNYKPRVSLEATFDRVEAIFMMDTLYKTWKQHKAKTAKQPTFQKRK